MHALCALCVHARAHRRVHACVHARRTQALLLHPRASERVFARRHRLHRLSHPARPLRCGVPASSLHLRSHHHLAHARQSLRPSQWIDGTMGISIRVIAVTWQHLSVPRTRRPAIEGGFENRLTVNPKPAIPRALKLAAGIADVRGVWQNKQPSGRHRPCLFRSMPRHPTVDGQTNIICSD